MPWTKDNENWDLDGLHFSRRGSQELGQRLAQYLQNEDETEKRPTWMPKMRTKNKRKKAAKMVGEDVFDLWMMSGVFFVSKMRPTLFLQGIEHFQVYV